jgi:hypothetical protein
MFSVGARRFCRAHQGDATEDGQGRLADAGSDAWLGPITKNVKTWSWVVLIIGAVMILAGFLIFTGNTFGRVVGIIVASVNALVQLAYLNHNTFWSLTMILIDIPVIYGLAAHGGRLDEWTVVDDTGV